MSGTISKAHYNDRAKARAESNKAKKIAVVRLTKKGTPSKVERDTQYFWTDAQAELYIQTMAAQGVTCVRI
jgi:hypothetical protein